MPRAAKINHMEVSPWYFDGERFTQDMVGKYEGFVYLITNTTNGRRYVGKKFFWSMRKPPGKTRRKKIESDWCQYFGSCKELLEDVKAHGPENFRRDILSLHTLKRDVNFCEVREQWIRDVLEEVDESGKRVYYNENISGKYFPYLVIGWKDRSHFSTGDRSSHLPSASGSEALEPSPR